MNPSSSQQPARRPLPARELFAGSGVPEEILLKQEKMEALLPAWFWKIDRRAIALSDKSDWEDEEI